MRLGSRLATSRMRKGGSMGPSINSSWAHLFADNRWALGALGTSGREEIPNNWARKKAEPCKSRSVLLRMRASFTGHWQKVKQHRKAALDQAAIRSATRAMFSRRCCSCCRSCGVAGGGEPAAPRGNPQVRIGRRRGRRTTRARNLAGSPCQRCRSPDRPAVDGYCKERGDCIVVDKHRLTLAVLIVALAAFMLGCTAHAQPSKTETTLANVAKDLLIPVEAEHKKNPVLDTEEAVKQGRLLFAQSCAVCHGTDGRGGTDLGRNMYPPAMDMTSPHVQHWSDAELLWIIQNGVRLTGMPSWQSSLSETDSWKLARFIHNLPRFDAATAARQLRHRPNRPPHRPRPI